MSNSFRMVDLITKKRCGEAHSPEEIKFIIDGVKNGMIPDYQMSAWLMAVCINGKNFNECAVLTEAMAHSGDILDLSEIGEIVIDKHSTGGVGDKTTLIIIPLLAAAGLPVAKLSGRGLGHTGGTIDKLEAIPGFRTDLDLDEFIGQVKSIGAAIASQTAKLAPADGKMYALRDVTGTVDSIPLIASSVVSKKIAAGANVIVLDVKCGSGAFMKDFESAKELSKTMVEIGKRLKKSITSVITSMEQPLGMAVGNSLEVIESIDTLKNQGPEDLEELCLYLGAVALKKAYLASSITEGKTILKKYLEDGSAFEKFKELVRVQNGDVESLENYDKLPKANIIVPLKADRDGFIGKVDALKIAKACKILGAGRDRKEDTIDYAVGIVLNKKIGHSIKAGEPLAYIHANSEELLNKAIEIAGPAFEISEANVQPTDLVLEIIE